MKTWFVFARLVSVLSVAAVGLQGQTSTANILGSVSDPSGVPMPNLTVTALQAQTGETRTTRTDESGYYLISNLPVGSWRVEVRADGFKAFRRDGIQLDVNRNARVDVMLSLGEVTQSVEITGDAPQVDTRQVQLGSLVDSRRVRELPLSGRNVYSLASLIPGVTSVGAQTISTRDGNTLRVNGSRSRHSTFLMDGGMNNSHWRNGGNAAPNPEAVQEVKVVTSNYNAEYGRSSGAVVSVVTRSGTNEWHGSAYEYLRNNKLDARSFFVPTVPPLRQNQYGAALGAPIRKNKLLQFGAWESLRIRSSQFVNSGRPATAAERSGQFGTVRDPLTQQPFAGGVIPTTRMDPVALKILDVVPLPNTADGRLETLRGTSADQHQFTSKTDYLINDSHRLAGTFFHLRNSRFKPFNGSTQIPGYGEYRESYGQYNAILTETWIVSATTLNEARFTYLRNRYDDRPLTELTWASFGSQIPVAASFHKPFPPDIRLNGRWRMGAENDNQGQRDDSFIVTDTLSWVKGAHSLRMGGYFSFDRYNALLSLAGAGIMTVGGEATGNVLADFMMGRATSLRQTNGTRRAFRKWDAQTFVQDDWRIHKQLTLNLGVRYELYPRFYSLLKDLQTFRPGVQSTVIPGAPLGMAFEGDPGISRSMAPLDKNNFAPRVGLAWDVTGSGRTAVRAGYGLFYSTPFADSATYLQQQPFQTDITVFGISTFVNPYAQFGGTPFPASVDPSNPFFTRPISLSWMSESIATPYIQQYSFALQHQLPWNTSVTAAYVGNTSRKLVNTRDANQSIFGPGATSANVNARRPILPGTYGQISQFESASNAHYDSLQITVDRRFSRNFSLLMNYTLGKSIDEVSDDNFNPTDVSLVDSLNRRLERAVSGSDIRHTMAFSYVWDLPGLKSSHALIRTVLGGWQTNGILMIRSGTPVNVTTGNDVNLDGKTGDRPDLVGSPVLSQDRSRAERIAAYFNTAAFAAPVTGSIGTAGRNLFYGPGSMTWDTTLMKNFAVRENHRITVRAEFFNAPNRVNLGNPTGTRNNANFGRILSTDSARVVQLALRYGF
ncbi:MAG: TonB-dependent receptor [Bryobacteraceae bacterium]|nr:TonB-dependent receptor [Bryobacteraceae bacterium]